MKSACAKIRRARPLLGTFVEITAQGKDDTLLRKAIEEAFGAVCKVHQLMNFHDTKSDVGRLNRIGSKRSVRVHPWTHDVLKSATHFSRMTAGALDITVAPLWRERHASAAKIKPDLYGDWSDIILESHHHVFFRRPLLIDLGGLAKGFAVDRATEALATAGADGGVVNAGGDLRVFGPEWHTAEIRHPLDLGASGREIRLRDRALATSAISQSHADTANSSPFVDGRTKRVITGHLSASVTAADCITADALTKAALIMRDQAIPLLRQHGASALLLSGDSPGCENLRDDETRFYQA